MLRPDGESRLGGVFSGLLRGYGPASPILWVIDNDKIFVNPRLFPIFGYFLRENPCLPKGFTGLTRISALITLNVRFVNNIT